MSSVRIPRTVRHGNGATGKTLAPELPLGTRCDVLTLMRLRKKKKYAKRYGCGWPSEPETVIWLRRDHVKPR